MYLLFVCIEYFDNFLVNLLTFVCKYAIIYAYNIRGQQDERIAHNSLKAAAKVFR